MDKLKRKIRKYYEFAVTKVKLIFEQKIFTHGDVAVKYMLKKNSADTLVIVFSACTRKGLKARYNYVRTLQDLSCNRLYILDDYGADCRGSYYMGKDYTFTEEVATKALIDQVIQDVKPKKIVFCGSSKGGYAALNFGLQYANSDMIIGAPQYFLGTYLEMTDNLATLEHIVGEKTPEKMDALDHRLQKRILENDLYASQRVYLHYSDSEHTYGEHVVYMLSDLKEKGYDLSTDVGKYTDHSELSIYFPDYLKKNVSAVISR